MYVSFMHAWCPWKQEERVRGPGTVATVGCELLCGCLESNLGPLKEQPELLPVELSLQSQIPDSSFFGILEIC